MSEGKWQSAIKVASIQPINYWLIVLLDVDVSLVVRELKVHPLPHPPKIHPILRGGPTMSLKFGIYLVEQRIVTAEQFCGLVKIQQESTRALPTLALQKSLMTIRQVANVLEAIERSPEKDFQRLAIEMGYLHAKEAEYLIQVQQSTAETIRDLAVECGLLTERQASVLYLHFQKKVSKKSTIAQTPAATKQPTKPATSAPNESTSRPKQPNFRRRPMIIEKQNANA